VLDTAAGRVVVEIYLVAPELVRQLDRLEGVSDPPRADDEYLKRNVTLLLDGRAIDGLVYEINPQRIVGAPLIDDGDWLAQPRR
jgi:gamma-glutamylcyclotransferase (GGCT)/AIG2-like uncharacterized protein YtfP